MKRISIFPISSPRDAPKRPCTPGAQTALLGPPPPCRHVDHPPPHRPIRGPHASAGLCMASEAPRPRSEPRLRAADPNAKTQQRYQAATQHRALGRHRVTCPLPSTAPPAPTPPPVPPIRPSRTPSATRGPPAASPSADNSGNIIAGRACTTCGVRRACHRATGRQDQDDAL